MKFTRRKLQEKTFLRLLNKKIYYQYRYDKKNKILKKSEFMFLKSIA